MACLGAGIREGGLRMRVAGPWAGELPSWGDEGRERAGAWAGRWAPCGEAEGGGPGGSQAGAGRRGVVLRRGAGGEGDRRLAAHEGAGAQLHGWWSGRDPCAAHHQLRF